MKRSFKDDMLALRAAALDAAQEALEAQAAQQKRLANAGADLLSALRDVLSMLEEFIDEETDARAYRIEKARAAIAKATGERYVP